MLVSPSSLIQAWDWHSQSANTGGVSKSKIIATIVKIVEEFGMLQEFALSSHRCFFSGNVWERRSGSHCLLSLTGLCDSTKMPSFSFRCVVYIASERLGIQVLFSGVL